MNEQMDFKNNCKINYMFKIKKSSYLKKTMFKCMSLLTCRMAEVINRLFNQSNRFILDKLCNFVYL